jgi:hypothetical protein
MGLRSVVMLSTSHSPLASDVDWGSVPDWIAGVGSALAFIGFATAFVWEVRKRRQDDAKRRQDDERAAEEARDALKRYARLVLMKVSRGSETQLRLTINNASSGPIIDVVTTVWVRIEGPSRELREVALDRRSPDATELGAGDSGEVWLWFADGERIPQEQEFVPQIEFTDCNGNRWRRLDNQQPVQVID